MANFWNFRNSDKIYINCKIYLLLQFSFNRFETLQDSSTGYEHYVLCFFWRSNYFWIFGEFLNFWNIGIIYSNCEMYLFLQFSFNRYEIMQGFYIGYRRYGLFFFFWRLIQFWFFGEFWKFLNFRNNDICNNCKMHLLLQF